MKNVIIGRFKTINCLLVTILLISLSSCSEDEDDEVVVVDPVDLEEISGKYKGLWLWTPGNSAITMIVRELDGNMYSVSFYESSRYKPGFNSDGVTPDAIGTIEMDGVNATIDLLLKTDSPRCNGNYTGSGTRNSDGQFRFEMDIVHDCADDGTATFTFEKEKDL